LKKARGEVTSTVGSLRMKSGGQGGGGGTAEVPPVLKFK
jgi:hypothetical protein